jgi:hypothetical protein
MRMLLRVVVVCGLTALLASPVLAQGGRGNRGGGGGATGFGTLLTNDSVQKELKIEKEQADKVKEAVTKVTDAHKDDTAKLRDLTGEERRTKTAELNATMNDETLKAVDDILKPEQIKRLKEIDVQQAGANAFARADVEKALSLKDDQKEKIKGINADTAKAMADLRMAGGGGGGGANRAANQEKITALRKETMDKIQALLTDDQKKTWKDLTGDAFTLVRPNRRGGN